MEFDYFNLRVVLISRMIQWFRWFEWDLLEGKELHNLALKSSGKILQPLEDVGLQLALSFNEEGSLLATGGEVVNYFLL